MVSFFFNEHLQHLLDTTPAIRSSACIKSQFQRVVSGIFCRSKIPLFLVKSKFQLSPSMFSEKSPQHLLESPSTFWLESYGDNIFIIFHHKSKHPPSLTNQNYVFGCPFCIELEIRARWSFDSVDSWTLEITSSKSPRAHLKLVSSKRNKQVVALHGPSSLSPVQRARASPKCCNANLWIWVKICQTWGNREPMGMSTLW